MHEGPDPAAVAAATASPEAADGPPPEAEPAPAGPPMAFTPTATPVTGGSGRAAVAGLLAALTLAAVSLAAATVARPAPVAPTGGSPTAVVEAYAAALAAGDSAMAWSLLSDTARDGQTWEDFSSFGMVGSGVRQSITVTGETIAGSSARVTGEVTMSYEDLEGFESFGPPSEDFDMTETVTIDLALGPAGTWLIDEPMFGLMPVGDF